MFRPRVPAGDANLECDFLKNKGTKTYCFFSKYWFSIDLRIFRIFKKSWLSDPNLFPRWIKGGGTHSRFPKNLKRYQKSREIVQKNTKKLHNCAIYFHSWQNLTDLQNLFFFIFFKNIQKILLTVLDAPAPSSKEPWLGPRRTENFGFSENCRKQIFTRKTST